MKIELEITCKKQKFWSKWEREKWERELGNEGEEKWIE